MLFKTELRKKKLVSFPSSRKFRFSLKEGYLGEGFDVISIEAPDNFFSGTDVLAYPQSPPSQIERFCFRFLGKVNRSIAFKAKSRRSDFDAGGNIDLKLIGYLFSLKIIKDLFESIIINVFKHEKYDKLVSKYDSVEIFTVSYITELFLYSSAVRLEKDIYYSIDGWDIYENFWLPTKVNKYEVWGPYFSHLLKMGGVEKEKLWFRIHPFRSFKMNSPQYITVYEAPTRLINVDLQIFIIRTLLSYARDSNLKVRVKLLNQSNIKKYLLDFEYLNIYITGVAYTDQALSVKNFVDELYEVVPDTALFVALGLSHGIIEFGVNGVPAICFQQRIWESQGLLNKYLENCGIEFVNCCPLPSTEEIFTKINKVLVARPTFQGYIFKNE